MKVVSDYRKNNIEDQRAYMNSYIRKIGRVKELSFMKHVISRVIRNTKEHFVQMSVDLWHMLKVTPECWLWKGAIDRKGYGFFCF